MYTVHTVYTAHCSYLSTSSTTSTLRLPLQYIFLVRLMHTKERTEREKDGDGGKQLYFFSGFNSGPVYHLRVVEQKLSLSFALNLST